MKTITIHEAKTHLSKYIKQAKEGQKIYIGGFGKAEVVLTAVPNKPKKRDFSKIQGLVHDFGDAFSEETDKEIANLLLNGPL